MCKRNSLLFIGLLLLCFATVAQNVVIKGKLLHNKYSEVTLISAYQKDAVSLAQAKIKDDGDFSISANIPSTDLYMLKFAEQKFFLLCLSPQDHIKITLDADNLQKVVEVEGSRSVAFTKELTDLLAGRQNCLDSINRELQTDKNQLYLSNYAVGFNSFHQSFVDVQPDIVSALQKCDSLSNLLDSNSKNGKIDKKNVETFLTAAITNLKLLKNYYASFNNYLQINDPTPYTTRNNSTDYKDFDAKVSSYLSSLKEYNDLIPNTLGNYATQAEKIVSEYEDALYDGKLDNMKVKMEYAGKIASLISKNKVSTKTSENINSQVAVITRLGSSIIADAQKSVQEIVAKYQREFNEKNEVISMRANDLMMEHKTDLATLMFLDNFSQDKKLYGDVLNALNNAYPTHPLVQERYNKINSPAFRTAEGNIAPELEFQNPDGKTLKLSDLRGKVVLVDFWASWCGPCRRENPHVVNLYAKYHDKGFEVFSVSLDNTKAKWVEAIQKDKLTWPNHVSDLKGWASAAAKLYGVNSIPCTFLLDREGRIIARGLRGDALTQKLQQIFGE